MIPLLKAAWGYNTTIMFIFLFFMETNFQLPPANGKWVFVAPKPKESFLFLCNNFTSSHSWKMLVLSDSMVDSLNRQFWDHYLTENFSGSVIPPWQMLDLQAVATLCSDHIVRKLAHPLLICSQLSRSNWRFLCYIDIVKFIIPFMWCSFSCLGCSGAQAIQSKEPCLNIQHQSGVIRSAQIPMCFMR